MAFTEYEDTFLRPCPCDTEEDFEKSFCYVQGTDMDKSVSDDVNELSENVWFAVKPPRKLGTKFIPLISCRKIHIVREKLKDKNHESCEVEKRQLAAIDISKKKNAVKFLSKTQIEYDK